MFQEKALPFVGTPAYDQRAMKEHTLKEEKADSRVCWSCHLEAGTSYFCQHCSRLQPLTHEKDYFAILGIGRRLHIDLEEMEAIFYGLSRKLHPDFYQTRSELEKKLSMDWTSALNSAYETLKEPMKRVEYLLTLEGIPIDHSRTKPPTELIEDILNIQEDLSTLRGLDPTTDTEGVEAVQKRILEEKKKLESRKTLLEQRLLTLSSSWDEMIGKEEASDKGLMSQRPVILSGLRDALSEIAYLRTILRDIHQALEKADQHV